MRIQTYILCSILFAGLMTTVAFVERPNFYSAGVAIGRSGITILALGNVALIASYLVGKMFLSLFFGELRLLEQEHLYERTWFTVTESFLALGVFRDDFTFKLGIFFIILMFLRVFHWVSADRVDLMFQSLHPPSMYLTLRMTVALIMLAIVDIQLVNFCYQEAFSETPGIMIMFTLHFCLLFITIVKCAGRFVLNVQESIFLRDHEDEDSWEPKSLGIFVVSVVTDVLRLILFVLMFLFMIKPFGIPLHIIGDVYMTVRDLVTRVRDFIKFLRARSQMERDMADATDADLARDNVCIICREDMVVNANQSQRYIPKKLSCGHVIHHGCLKSWLERSQRCPTCRRPVMESNGTNTNDHGGATDTGPPPPAAQERPDANGAAANVLRADAEQNGGADHANEDATATENAYFTNPTETQTVSSSSATNTSDLNNGSSITVNASAINLPPDWKTLRARELASGELEVKVNHIRTIKMHR